MTRHRRDRTPRWSGPPIVGIRIPPPPVPRETQTCPQPPPTGGPDSLGRHHCRTCQHQHEILIADDGIPRCTGCGARIPELW